MSRAVSVPRGIVCREALGAYPVANAVRRIDNPLRDHLPSLFMNRLAQSPPAMHAHHDHRNLWPPAGWDRAVRQFRSARAVWNDLELGPGCRSAPKLGDHTVDLLAFQRQLRQNRLNVGRTQGDIIGGRTAVGPLNKHVHPSGGNRYSDGAMSSSARAPRAIPSFGARLMVYGFVPPMSPSCIANRVNSATLRAPTFVIRRLR